MQDTDRVIDRLRELEMRLTSLGGKSSFQPEELRSALSDREQTRAKFYTETVRQASAFALELTKSIDAGIARRMDPVADRAIAKLDFTLPPLTFSGVDQRLAEQEQRVPVMMQKFAELREFAVTLEDRLAKIGDNLDSVWKQQESTGLGGWRLVMRAVSAQVELEKQQAPPVVPSYRATTEPTEALPAAAANIICPRCNQTALRRIARESLLEEILRIVFVAPYRCANCGVRSYRFRYTVTTAG